MKQLPPDHEAVVEVFANCLYKLVVECPDYPIDRIRAAIALASRGQPDVAARVVKRTQYLLAEVGQEAKINLVMGLDE